MRGIRFTVAGIPVRVEPAFIVLSLLIGFVGSRTTVNFVILVGSVFVSVLVHELGHAVTFRVFGRQPNVVLHGMGGVTSAAGPVMSRGKDMLVTVAGSTAQILLIGVPALLLRDPLAIRYQSEVLYDALQDLMFVSLAWGFLNLVPVIPLDGGKLMARFLELFTKHSAQIAHWVSAVVAASGAIWGFLTGEPFLGLMGVMFTALNMRGVIEQREAPVYERLREGHRLIDAGDPGAALRIAEESRRGVSVHARNAGVELAAWAHLARGDQRGLEGTLTKRKGRGERSGFLAAYTALDRGDRDAAMVVLERAYLNERPFPPNALLATRLAREGMLDELTRRLAESGGVAGATAVASIANSLHDAARYEDALRLRLSLYSLGLDPAGDAYNVACTYARLGDRATALAWLGRALEHGFDDVAVMDQDADLDSVRDAPEFAALRSKLAGTPS